MNPRRYIYEGEENYYGVQLNFYHIADYLSFNKSGRSRFVRSKACSMRHS